MAGRYDAVWGRRFETVAARLADRLAPKAGERALDIGTGTGIGLAALESRAGGLRLAAGCDRSPAMLGRARVRVPSAVLAAGDVDNLPFADGLFDLLAASFVLSHVPEPARALAEARRVLRPGGRLGVTNWAASADDMGAVWNDCLAAAITAEEAERASKELVPAEARLAKEGLLAAALTGAGFVEVGVDGVVLEMPMSVDDYLDDREMSGGGRCGRSLLGEQGWPSFRARVRAAFFARFGTSLVYRRRALVAGGRKPSSPDRHTNGGASSPSDRA